MSKNEWMRRRQYSLGASDTPTLIAGPAYNQQSALRIALAKRGDIPVESTRLTPGHHLERAGRSWLAEQLAVDVGSVVDYHPERDNFAGWCSACQVGVNTVSRENSNVCVNCGTRVILHANLDGRILFNGKSCVYEHKLVSTWNRHDWIDKIPDHALIQVEQQMLCSGLNYAVAVIFDCNSASWRIHQQTADMALREFIIDYTARWWRKYVIEKNDPRCDDWAERNTLARLRWPATMETVEIAAPDGARELMAQLEKLRAARKHNKDRIDSATAKLREMLGNATAMVGSNYRIYRTKSNVIKYKERE